MELKKSDKLEKLIKAYQDEREKIESRSTKSIKQAEEIASELAETKLELEKAMDATLELSNEANLKRERDLRRKVAELELDLKGAEARKGRAFTSGSSKAQAIANQAEELARQEAQEALEAGTAAKKKAIEDAKYAYLQSLVDYYKFTNDATGIYFDALRELGREGDTLNRPRGEELLLFRSGGYDNRLGVLDLEIKAAYERGKIGRFSVAPDRVIE